MKKTHCFSLLPRHKWFSCTNRNSDQGWFGPCNTIEDAIFDLFSNTGSDERIFISQGFKLTKALKEEQGSEYEWEVDVKNILEILISKESK